jgi:hypothetical protein
MPQIPGLSPWISMWNQPRATVRALILSTPSYGVFLLAAMYALQSFFFYANWWSLTLSEHYRFFLSLGILASPILGILWLYVTTLLFFLIGRLLRGTAPYAHLRTVVGWSLIPYSIPLFMWLILIFISPQDVFIHDSEGASALFINFIGVIVATWSLILLIQGIREVQHFSIAKSILNVFLVSLLNLTVWFIAVSFFRPLAGYL